MNSPADGAKNNKEARSGSRRPENLALLYQGLLTGIVRMRSGRQHISDAESFRSRTKAALQEVERDAIAAGYDGSDIRETHFAVVAFLDSAVFHSNEPIRAEWERKTLQEDLFGQTDAGEVFFEKLDRLRSRRDSHQLADILEVYLLCLLLGFEGRYSGALRGELYSIQDKVKARIDDIRGTSRRIAPSGLPEETEPQPVTPVPRARPYGLIMLTAAVITVVLFLMMKLQLIFSAGEIRDKLF